MQRLMVEHHHAVARQAYRLAGSGTRRRGFPATGPSPLCTLPQPPRRLMQPLAKAALILSQIAPAASLLHTKAPCGLLHCCWRCWRAPLPSKVCSWMPLCSSVLARAPSPLVQEPLQQAALQPASKRPPLPSPPSCRRRRRCRFFPLSPSLTLSAFLDPLAAQEELTWTLMSDDSRGRGAWVLY